jgi:hypothetical protein
MREPRFVFYRRERDRRCMASLRFDECETVIYSRAKTSQRLA